MSSAVSVSGRNQERSTKEQDRHDKRDATSGVCGADRSGDRSGLGTGVPGRSAEGGAGGRFDPHELCPAGGEGSGRKSRDHQRQGQRRRQQQRAQESRRVGHPPAAGRRAFQLRDPRHKEVQDHGPLSGPARAVRGEPAEDRRPHSQPDQGHGAVRHDHSHPRRTGSGDSRQGRLRLAGSQHRAVQRDRREGDAGVEGPHRRPARRLPRRRQPRQGARRRRCPFHGRRAIGLGQGGGRCRRSSTCPPSATSSIRSVHPRKFT